VDHRRHVHAVGPRFVPEESHVLAQVAAVKVAIIVYDLGGVWRGGLHQAAVQEVGQVVGGVVGGQGTAVFLLHKRGKPGNRVWVGVEDVAHPVRHAHFIVQLDHDDVAAVGDLTGREHGKYRLKPILDAGQEVRV